MTVITVSLASGDEFVMVRGEGGNDTLTGGDGFDRLDYRSSPTCVTVNVALGTASDGFGTTDTFSGFDEYRGSDHNDVFIGGDGFDLVTYDRAGVTGVIVDLSAGTATGTWDGQGFTDTLTSIESVRGSSVDDTLTGDELGNRLDGRSGNDTIDGGGGTDRVTGGAGTDTFIFNDVGGTVTVTDFEGGAGAGDQLDVSAFGFASFAAIQAVASASGISGQDTLITLDGDDSILLKDFDMADLNANDVILV